MLIFSKYVNSITLKYQIKDHVCLLSLEFSSSMVAIFPAWSFILKNFFSSMFVYYIMFVYYYAQNNSLFCMFITSCSFIRTVINSFLQLSAILKLLGPFLLLAGALWAGALFGCWLGTFD